MSVVWYIVGRQKYDYIEILARDTIVLPSSKNSGKGNRALKQVKIVVERHSDGYVAYPVVITGVVVGEGDSYEEALADVKSAIAFHIESFRFKSPQYASKPALYGCFLRHIPDPTSLIPRGLPRQVYH